MLPEPVNIPRRRRRPDTSRTTVEVQSLLMDRATRARDSPRAWCRAAWPQKWAQANISRHPQLGVRGAVFSSARSCTPSANHRGLPVSEHATAIPGGCLINHIHHPVDRTPQRSACSDLSWTLPGTCVLPASRIHSSDRQASHLRWLAPTAGRYIRAGQRIANRHGPSGTELASSGFGPLSRS